MARQTKQKVEKKKSSAGEGGRRPREDVPSAIGFTSHNIKLLIVSLVVIVLGFIFLSRGSITLAPILLVLGYCVLVPISIIYKPKRPNS